MKPPYSKNLGWFEHKSIRLSLGLWHNLYGPTYEIGFRDLSTDDFSLIYIPSQSREKWWGVAQRMVKKGRCAATIQKVIDRLIRDS